MSRFFGIILLVIALTLSVEGTAQEQPKQKIRCSDISPGYKAARDDFNKQYMDLIASRFRADKNTAVDITPLNVSAYHLLDVANKTCSNGTLHGTFNYSSFLNLVKFSLDNATILKDLHEKGAFKCINEQKDGIKQCINASAVHWQSGNAIQKARLNFNSGTTCLDTLQTRNCTVKLLEEKQCGSDAVAYVNSLFNYLLDNYCIDDEHHTSSAERITGLLTTFTMLAMANGIEWLMV